MSSRIVPGDSPFVESVPWRRPAVPGGAALPPPRDPEEQPVDPAIPLREALAVLETRLVAVARAADEREARAVEAGKREGYANGQRDATAAAETESSRALAAVQAEAADRAAGVAAQAVDLRHRLREQMEADLVRLAVAVARRILRRELTVDPDALLGIVKSAVERIAAREVLSIRVCPRDEARVQSRLAEFHLPERVQVIADTSLAWGSVLIETTRGQHDASVETQIEEIDRGLADLVGRPS
jgi:flagellar assembly protein FliH